MVRLKDNVIYSSINFAVSFQFLMVRLKEPCGVQGNRIFINFNSLWCD